MYCSTSSDPDDLVTQIVRFMWHSCWVSSFSDVFAVRESCEWEPRTHELRFCFERRWFMTELFNLTGSVISARSFRGQTFADQTFCCMFVYSLLMHKVTIKRFVASCFTCFFTHARRRWPLRDLSQRKWLNVWATGQPSHCARLLGRERDLWLPEWEVYGRTVTASGVNITGSTNSRNLLRVYCKKV